MYICIDFDGTMVEHHYPAIGPVLPEAFEYMKKFTDRGDKIILFTMRGGVLLSDAVDFIEDQGIKLYGVNHNPRQEEWTSSPKAWGHIYIDDAAVGCPLIDGSVDWSVVGPDVMGMISG